MTTTESKAGATRPKLPLNEIRRADGAEKQSPSRSLPQQVSKHYHQDGNAFRSAYREDKIEFVDRGNRLHAYRPVSTFTARTMAEVAAMRGWKALEITGDKEFKSKAYIELASRGIDVKGYEPSQTDRDLLQKRMDRKAAQDDPKVQAFVAAQDAKAMKAAVKKYPQLKEAFALRTALEKAAEHITDPKAKDNYLQAQRSNIALAVYRGAPMPEIKLRDTSQQQASPTPDKGAER